MELDQLLEDFSYLGNWEDRYQYVIELGRELEPLPDELRTESNKVRGCVSQVWLASQSRAHPDSADEVMWFKGESDAHIVRGLIAILLAIYCGRTPQQILETDAREILSRFGLEEHLTPQRSNGLFAMVERIRADAAARTNMPQPV
ncbi:MAG: SufE family protein [Rhizobiales bacterium]|nr:SufE family protein [Hyphomicrobiales bacterium]